ncbi:MAG: UDP-N-acetylmuramate--L-alanine ligase [Bacteroidetes bacterium]|nr:UDP-N-acetylmuramate--L-alanine ligase [Bacteroidota bacterium]
MNNINYPSVFFMGIGGIGMSAIARYFLRKGTAVLGYDRTRTALTECLKDEGATVVYEDFWLPEFDHLDLNNCLLIITPAIPENSRLLTTFKQRGFFPHKRAEILGQITRAEKSLGVAGTHGKSTTSAMLAYLISNTSQGCNAFLGAIATNFNNNYVFSEKAEYTIMEADEFDRSFLFLSPLASIITSVDPDHLDIYGNSEKFHEGFRQYAMKIDPRGVLVVKEGIELASLCRRVNYALESSSADYVGFNLSESDGGISFDLKTPKCTLKNIRIGINGQHNAENAVAALALCAELGFDLNALAPSFANFQGIKRRFEVVYKTDNLVYIDDYAHHPTEIRRLISSVRAMYPGKTIIGVFQPHLFSRTRDFADGFAEELAKLDQLLLLPIYPAREEPILGVNSTWLLSKVKLPNKKTVNTGDLLNDLRDVEKGVLLTIGAGDIDRLVVPIKEFLSANELT